MNPIGDAVMLLLRMKAAVKVRKATAAEREAFNAEARDFGPDLMAEAQLRLGEALEAERERNAHV